MTGKAEGPGGPLPTHGRYSYSAIKHRPAYAWPNGTRLAVYIGLNMEHFAFGEGLGAELAPGGHHPDVLNFSWRDYGNRVGVWRLIDLFNSLQLPASVLVNSSIYSYCPEVMDAFRARGDEVLGHGRTNSERQGGFDETAERTLIAETTEVIAAAESRRPKGWLGPWISESHVTPDLLAEAGYSYVLDWCMDDQPVWLAARNGKRILAVPYPQELNDIPAIVARKDSAEQFEQMIVDQFDEMLEQSAAAPLVMGMALHPYIVGQPYRLRRLRNALSHIAAHRDKIWLTTSGGVSDHCHGLPPGIVP
jgi:peptidoglycan/xylan/chitin deacetylase (PgdA/CDA1 family)